MFGYNKLLFADYRVMNLAFERKTNLCGTSALNWFNYLI